MVLRKQKYRGKKVLILGLGSHPEGSGVGATRFFVRHGAAVRVTDLKTAAALRPAVQGLRDLPVTFHLGGHRRADVDWAEIVVQNPGVPFHSDMVQYARRRHKLIETDLTLLVANKKPYIIGISGTRGKSTTAALLHHLLRRKFPTIKFGGNIGLSPLIFLDQLRPGSPLVLELSSWMLEGLARVKYSPPLAILTNVYPDHRDRYGTDRAYRRAKSLLFAWQRPGDSAITFAQQPLLRRLIPSRSRAFTFSGRRPVRRGVGVDGGYFVYSNNRRRRIAPVSALTLAGSHNLDNAAAALTAAVLLGVPATKIAAALKNVHGLPHRLEKVRRLDGVDYINDSHATTPVATVTALESVAGRVILIAGGVDKQLPFQTLASLIKKRASDVIMLPGSASVRLGRLLQRSSVKRHRVRSMAEAVKKARSLAPPHSTVLLSPAAASFNLFRHATERGDQFRVLVKNFK